MIQVMGFPPLPGDDSSPDWQILLHGHFLPYALPTFFFAQFNPVSVSYTPLDNSKKFLSPCSIILSNICKWLLFLLSHYLAQPIWIRSFIFSCYPLPLAFSNFFGICAQNLSLKKKCSDGFEMEMSKSRHETFLSEASSWKPYTLGLMYLYFQLLHQAAALLDSNVPGSDFVSWNLIHSTWHD